MSELRRIKRGVCVKKEYQVKDKGGLSRRGVSNQFIEREGGRDGFVQL